MVLSCPRWTGIPTPLVLGVEIGFAPRTFLVTYLGIVFDAMGSLCLQRFFAMRKRFLAFQALRFLLRHQLFLVRRLFRKSRPPVSPSSSSSLPPFRRAG